MKRKLPPSKLVVIMVDMQDFFLKGLTKENKERILLNQSTVIDFCAKHRIPLIVLEYKNRGTTTRILLTKLQRVPHRLTVIKEHNSGFRDTDLGEVLGEMKVKKVFLMGINGSGCVQDTAIGALYRGYKVVTSAAVIASSSIRDRNLATSRKWYSEKGMYLENMPDTIEELAKF